MRVLYFGTYERDYPRNAQVISCLRGAGVEVVENHIPLWDGERHKLSPNVRTLGRAIQAEIRLAQGSAGNADVVLVGYPGHIDMPAAKRVAGKRPVVFNPLVSLEDTMIGDRALASSSSLRAHALRRLDRFAFRSADLVVADTAAHAEYFEERFGLTSERTAVCYVGAEDRIFSAGERSEGPFNVLFVGKLIPLHGLETILAAAEICQEIEFHVVGSGQLNALLDRLPRNVHWERWVVYERLPDLYREAGCALGVFGLSEKAARVIPNKAFQALATGTPLITADTPAARELLTDHKDALLVAPGNPHALATAIRTLAAEPALRRHLSERGRQTYSEHASESVLGARWRSILDHAVETRTARGD